MFEKYFREIEELTEEFLFEKIDNETIYEIGYTIKEYLRKLKYDGKIEDYNCYLYKFEHDFKNKLNNNISYKYQIELNDFEGHKEIGYLDIF